MARLDPHSSSSRCCSRSRPRVIARRSRRTGRRTTATAAGSRYNAGETALGKATVGKLEEKWRFPADRRPTSRSASVHATPVVVDGHVYFGTVTQPDVLQLFIPTAS